MNKDTVDPAASQQAKTSRRKTPGACERCREKRVKCNGIQPCDQCTKRDESCTFDFPPSSAGNEVLARKLDLVLSQLDQLKRSIHQSGDQEKDILAEIRPRYVAQLNPQTGCFEYYGRTSTFMIASSLGQKFQELEEDAEVLLPRKRPRLDGRKIAATSERQEQNPESLGLSDLTGFSDYVPPSTALRQYRCLREDVADRHLESFFRTIHIFLPIFDTDRFWSRYHTIRPLFGESRLFVADHDNSNRQQFLCLLYAVLALGALYEDDRDDSSAWASWYFVEAQELLGRLLDAVNLELVQAAMLMGAYAQHAIKPNLAYNITGIATRLALSIGLNAPGTYDLSGMHAEEARRTWWLVYVQEVELSLDSGRPMWFPTSDVEIEFPSVERLHENSSDDRLQVLFIRYLAEVAKIASAVLKLMNSSMGRNTSISLAEIGALREDLQQWRISLPPHLQFDSQHNEMQEISDKDILCGWKARQRSSLRIHCNLVIIILHRNYFIESAANIWRERAENNARTHYLYKQSCISAAQDMINHIHRLFKMAPNLRRWSYYCFYCLQATLILLASLIDVERAGRRTPGCATTTQDNQSAKDIQTFTEEALKAGCELSIAIFEQIELKAARRCAEVVRRFLGKWAARRRQALNYQRCRYPSSKHIFDHGEHPVSDSHVYVDATSGAGGRPGYPLVSHPQCPPANRRSPIQPTVGPSASQPPSSDPADLADPINDGEGSLAQTSVLQEFAGFEAATDLLPPNSFGGLQHELYDLLQNDQSFALYGPGFLLNGDGTFGASLSTSSAENFVARPEY